MSATGSIVVRIGADDAQLQAALRRSQQGLAQLGSQMRAGVTAATKYGAAMAAAGAAVVAALVTKAMQSIDAQAKLARQLRATSTGLETVQKAGRNAGVSTEQMTAALRRLDVSLGEAARGSGRAAEIMDRLGLSVDEVARMDADQRIAAINQAIRENIPVAERAAVAAQLFGRGMGTALQEIDADALAEARREVEALGTSVSAVDAATIERANDALSSIGEVVRGIANRITVQLAHLIEAIAVRFREAAIESEGFGNQVTRGTEKAIRSIAFVADAIEGVRRAFLVAGKAIAATALAIQTSFLRTADMILSGPVEAINALIRTANNIPGINFGEVEQPDIVTGLRQELDMAREATRIAFQDIHETLMEPMPSSGLLQMWESVKAAADEASQATVAAREAMAGLEVAANDDDGGDERAEAELAKRREQMERRLAILRAGLEGEAELEQVRFEQRMEDLEAEFASEEELLAEFYSLKEGLEAEHQQKLSEIRQRAADDERRQEEMKNRAILQARQNFFSNIAGLMNTENRRAFQVGKAGALAQAGISGAQGIMEAWRSGMETSGPYAPLVAAGYAAAAAVNAGNLINNIRKQQFGGHGSTPTSPTQGSSGISDQGAGGGQVARSEPDRVVNISGIDPAQLYSGKQISSLLDALDEEARDRGLRILAA